MDYRLSEDELRRVRAELERNARHFDRPSTYIAGVQHTVAALRAVADGEAPWVAVELPEVGTPRMI